MASPWYPGLFSGRPQHSNPTTKDAKKVVRQIVRTLHKKAFKRAVGIQATEVFKGGSMGHGTRVPGRYDIDLVLYSRDINPDDVLLEDGYEDTLKNLDEYLESKLGDQYQYEEITMAALKFTYTMQSGTTLDVDLLLSPFWDRPEHFLGFLRTVRPAPKRAMFSASVSKWQTDLIRYQPQRVKELITRAKAWRNVQWDGSKYGRPKSILISLLIIVAYERVPAEIQTAKKRFKALAARTGEEFCELVREITTTPDLSLTIPGAPTFDNFRDLLPPKPRIIDPGNPSNNLYKSGVGPVTNGDRDKWKIFVQKLPTFDITETPMVIMGYR